MSTISETVDQYLENRVPPGYQGIMRQAIQALEDREQQIATNLSDHLVDQCNHTVEDALEVLRTVGLPVSESVPSSPEVIDQLLTSIDANVRGLVERVDGLTRFAQRHGYAG